LENVPAAAGDMSIDTPRDRRRTPAQFRPVAAAPRIPAPLPQRSARPFERIRSLESAAVYRLALLATFALGIAVRARYTLFADFPLNDGGLFYSMSADIRAANYALPSVTSYNGADIPFAYPPIGFYIAALLTDVTPLSLEQVFLYLPFVATCLTVPAFYLLARALLPSRMTVLLAVGAFALVPRSFIWLMMGGGVARSLGLLFGLLALYYVVLLVRDGKTRAAPLAAILTALTFASHLETGWFVALSAAVIYLAYGRDVRSAAMLAGVGVAAAALAAPWWVTVLSRHGLDPFLAASETGGSILNRPEDALIALGRMIGTSEPFFPVIGALGVLGAVYLVARRDFFVPAWWAAIILLDLRAYPTFTTIPIALSAAVAVTHVLVPALASIGRSPEEARTSSRMPAAATIALAALGVFVVIGAVISRPGLYGEATLLKPLGGDERSSLGWVSRETPADSTFLVVPSTGWEAAKTAEWFPVLAERVSMTTVQGTEWLPDGAFGDAVEAHDLAYLCGYTTSQCLDDWRVDTGRSFDYVYVPKPPGGQCCEQLVDSLAADGAYRLAYDGRGATIFERLDARSR
jgi:hypothetical protein